MDRQAGSAFHVFGIIATSILIIVASLLFLLYSLCWVGPSINEHDRGMLFLGGEILLLVLGGVVIGGLSRGLNPAFHRPPSDPPPRDHKALGPAVASSLTALIIIQFSITALISVYNFLVIDTARIAGGSLIRAALYSFLCYQGPYMLVLFTIDKKASQAISALALTTPSVLFLANLIVLCVAINLHRSNAILLAIASLPAIVSLAICWSAWNRVREIGAIPGPKELVPSVIILTIYFFYVHTATPWLYIMGSR